jgi:tetratricopeptide (TPR) repeat protein
VRTHAWLAALALLAVCGLAPAAPGPDGEKDLKAKALKLNDVTGDDAIQGQLQALVKDAAGTKKLLEAALALSKEKEQPFNFNACYILGRAAAVLREYEPAERFFKLAGEQALAVKSGSKLGKSYTGLIAILYDQKKYDEAEKLSKEFLEIEGDDALEQAKVRVLRVMIQAIAKQGKTDEAMKLADRLLKLDPDNLLSIDLKGWVQREAGQEADAVTTYEDLLGKVEKNKDLDKEIREQFAAEIRYILSGLYVDVNKVDKAAEALEALIKFEPDNPGFHNDLGYIWADHDMKLDEAEKEIRKALDLDKERRKKDNPNLKPEDDKDNSSYLDSLGWVLYKEKKYKEALKYLEEAVKDKEGQHVEIFDHLAETHLALGDKAAAVETWKKAVAAAGESKREQAKKAEVEKKLKSNQ